MFERRINETSTRIETAKTRLEELIQSWWFRFIPVTVRDKIFESFLDLVEAGIYVREIVEDTQE